MRQTSDLTQSLTLAQETSARATAVCYRLYTEDKGDIRLIQPVKDAGFDGFTLYHTVGYWQGSRENGVVLEIIGKASDAPRIASLAEAIRQVNNQTAVLVTSNRVNRSLIIAKVVAVKHYRFVVDVDVDDTAAEPADGSLIRDEIHSTLDWDTSKGLRNVVVRELNPVDYDPAVGR